MSLPILIYRFGNKLNSLGLKRVAKIVSGFNRVLFSTWIPSTAIIGKNFTIGYWGLGVVIHSNAKIGNNVTIAQNVTIGRNFGDKDVPVIGNDVYVGTGSVVFGEIYIGNNVIIGSNSLINSDIPDNCTVVGNPMRIIKKNRIKKYYQLDEKCVEVK